MSYPYNRHVKPHVRSIYPTLVSNLPQLIPRLIELIGGNACHVPTAARSEVVRDEVERISAGLRWENYNQCQSSNKAFEKFLARILSLVVRKTHPYRPFRMITWESGSAELGGMR